MEEDMSTPGKEIAKFACGFETFHVLMHDARLFLALRNG